MVDGWKGDPFVEINTEEISKEAEKYTKIVMRCQKGLRDDSTAVLHLKKQVFDFKDTMPIVTALGNKNYTQAHWNEIKEVTNIDIELEKLEFCLGELIDEEIAIHQEAIQEISTKATQEAKLISELEELKEEWSGLELIVKPYKEIYLVISDLEELQLLLDDMMTNINNILGNRYVATLRSKATILFQNLSSFLEIFDQWKDCQRNWLYLENIFVSDDIKQQTKTDYNEFEKVNKKYTDLMKSVNKNPRVCKYYEKFYFNELKSNNEKMDKIQKNLEAFLESKRQDFPRFFFLSNEELLQILAAAQDIKKVEKHLNKIFENIMKLELGKGNASNQIHKMISGEGEQVEFTSSVKIKTEDKIETTLKNIEDKMIETIKKKINTTHSGYNFENPERDQWVLKEIGQVITTVSQIIWTEITENYIEGMQETRYTALDDLKEMIVGQLDELTSLIRGKLEKVKRKILISLITADVHNRDIVNDLAEAKVDSIENFEWLKQLRYYNDEGEPCYVKQVNATLTYGYEYMGAASRLVITPLTDRCWMTITGALHIKLGAAPAGPAGTGKTESTKDLSKALGIQCVVFNCSDQIEYKMMGRLFSGLVSQGAWACLDEFNRIEEEVLSVIAQQLLTIKFALLKEAKEFEFNNSTLKVNPMVGVFVTMNPGYEGRTELPDNLAVLFRPVAMMIPNYGQIAEIMLYAEGFKDASNLSKKMVQLYKLASEQLSQQKHYDFGMRAVKSVLVMAGALKRENTNLTENVVLIRAMRDSNIPKFLSDDLPLFKALIQDLFPNVEIPEVDYGELQTQIVKVIKDKKLEPKPEFITKAIQLFDTFNVRFGSMIVGPTGGGKTTCNDVLACAMTELRENDSKDVRFQRVNCTRLNPKSISMGELYGEENPDTKEWTDGLASKILRENATIESNETNICIFDGPVDALWIENMNTVLDDNMALCLSNGERIKLKPTMRIVFEVQDLEVASPATVSRCGMVYMTPSDLGWAPYVNSWMKRMFSEREDVDKPCLNEEAQIFLRELFDSFVDETFEVLNDYRNDEPIQTFEIQSIISLCNFLENFINEEVGEFHYEDTANQFRQKLIKFFAFAFIWGMGGSFNTKGSAKVDQTVRKFFHNILPAHDTVFDYGINLETMKFEKWEIPSFDYDPTLPFFSILVPTVDTVRYSYLLNMCIKNKKPVFFTGETGVGKSVVIQKFLSLNKENMELSPINLNFSAQTDSLSTQQTIEANLIKKKGRAVLGANGNNTCVLFIDDVNMPSVEKYGAQPPIELLRQIIGGNVFYDRLQLFEKRIENFVTICSAAPPSGGRAALTPRFTRFFHVLCLPQPSEETMKSIFEGIIEGFFHSSKFPSKVSDCGRALVESTVLLYNLVTAEFLPTPSKFHYTFNLRDISKVFQGILMVKPISIENEAS